MGYKRYSDEQKAAALAALKSNGGNLFRTAHEIKIPLATIRNWSLDTREPVEGFAKLQTEKEETLSELCKVVARKYLKQAGDDYVVAATPGHLSMTAAGIAIDKSRLLDELPTSITSSTGSDSLDKFSRIARKLKPDITLEECGLLMKESMERIEGDDNKLIG